MSEKDPSHFASNLSLESPSLVDKPLDEMDGPEINEVNVVFVRYPDDCCPQPCQRACPCCDRFAKTDFCQMYWNFRCYMFKLVEHKYFETFIIVMIIASSLALVRLKYLHTTISIIFHGHFVYY